MSLKKQVTGVVLAALSVVALAACGGSGTPPVAGLSVGTAGEQLAFDKTALTAKAGDVKITFKNNSTGQQHNFVIIKGTEEDVAKVDEAAAAAGAPNYLPTDPNIVKGSAMLAAGKSEPVTATLAAGTYTYICTFPGHYGAGMKGTLTVQ